MCDLEGNKKGRVTGKESTNFCFKQAIMSRGVGGGVGEGGGGGGGVVEQRSCKNSTITIQSYKHTRYKNKK